MVGTPIKGRWRQFALWAVALPAFAANLIYISRAGILLMPLIVLVTALLSKRRGSGLIAAAFFVAFTLVLYQYAPGWFESFGERMSRLFAGAAGRASIREEALTVAGNHLLLGVGAGQFRFYSGGIWHAHNDTLTLLAEQGLIAAVSYFSAWVCVAYVSLSLTRAGGYYRVLGTILIVTSLAYLGYSQVEPLFNNRAGLLFAFIWGLCSSTLQRLLASKTKSNAVLLTRRA